MNKAGLTNRLKNLSLDKNVEYNLLLLMFFMEEFLTRISLSQYKNDFIFKGGFLLSSMLGINNRTTMDIDISIINIQLEEKKIRKTIEEIIKTINNQSITYEIQGIQPIRDGDQYGGLEIKLIGKLENIKQPFSIDIATGDPITPSAVEYEYQLMIENRKIPIKAYNLETVIAEKLQTIIARGLANSRSKDYYDLYIIIKTQLNVLNVKVLGESVINTFNYRETEWNIIQISALLELIKQNTIMKTRWKQYAKSHPFAKQLSHQEVIEGVAEVVSIMEIALNYANKE